MPGTDLATTSGALAIRPDQTTWTDEQRAVLRHMSTEKATKADLDVFLHRCQQLELDPFAGQIHLVEYGGKPTIQVGIHGLESIARTSADRGGFDIEWEDDLWCGPDGVWHDVWLSDEPPTAAKVVLIRDGKRYSAVALYRENVGMRKVYEGPKGNRQWTGEWEVNDMWTKRPAHQTAKCARAAALRKAFPRQLSNVYAPEELGERPETVQGQVVREDAAPAPTGLDDALALVAAASTRDELLAIWGQAAPGLSVTDRARLQQACTQAAEHIEQAPAASEPVENQEADLIEQAQALCVELGYHDVADQVRLACAIIGLDVPHWPDVPVEAMQTLIPALTRAVAAPDPQAVIEDLIGAGPVAEDPPTP